MPGIHDLVIEENITLYNAYSGEEVTSDDFILSDQGGNGVIEINIQNNSGSAIPDLGIYLATASTVGTWDNPPDHPAATDYQDAVKWGSKTMRLGPAEWEGGFRVYLNPDDVTDEPIWFSRTSGNNWLNRITINPQGVNPDTGGEAGAGTISEGGVSKVKIEFVAPPDIDARRLYVRFMVG